MYLDILSLIYVLCALHISCAARAVVKDTEAALEMAVPAADTTGGKLWISAVHDEIIPSKVRSDGRHAAEARMTPLVGTLWQTGVHEEVSPSRGNNRATEPEATPVAGAFWQIKGMASKLSAVPRAAEGAVPTRISGLLFQSAVHDKISDSQGKQHD